MSNMMHCASHGQKLIEAKTLKGLIKDEGHFKWSCDRLDRLLAEVPADCLSVNASSAYKEFSRSYHRDGIDGGLVHIKWLISSLRELPITSANREAMNAAEQLANALQLEW